MNYFPFFLIKNLLAIILTTHTIKAAIKAENNESTSTPETNLATSQKSKPLITNENKPKVNILIGSVNSDISGLMKALIKPNDTENIIAAQKLST